MCGSEWQSRPHIPVSVIRHDRMGKGEGGRQQTWSHQWGIQKLVYEIPVAGYKLSDLLLAHPSIIIQFLLKNPCKLQLLAIILHRRPMVDMFSPGFRAIRTQMNHILNPNFAVFKKQTKIKRSTLFRKRYI